MYMYIVSTKIYVHVHVHVYSCTTIHCSVNKAEYMYVQMYTYMYMVHVLYIGNLTIFGSIVFPVTFELTNFGFNDSSIRSFSTVRTQQITN